MVYYNDSSFWEYDPEDRDQLAELTGCWESCFAHVHDAFRFLKEEDTIRWVICKVSMFIFSTLVLRHVIGSLKS